MKNVSDWGKIDSQVMFVPLGQPWCSKSQRAESLKPFTFREIFKRLCLENRYFLCYSINSLFAFWLKGNQLEFDFGSQWRYDRVERSGSAMHRLAPLWRSLSWSVRLVHVKIKCKTWSFSCWRHGGRQIVSMFPPWDKTRSYSSYQGVCSPEDWNLCGCEEKKGIHHPASRPADILCKGKSQ